MKNIFLQSYFIYIFIEDRLMGRFHVGKINGKVFKIYITHSGIWKMIHLLYVR